MTPTRRRLLALGGLAAVGGLAGCSGGDGDPTTPAPTSTPAEDAGAVADFGDWFENVGNYDGTVADARGESALTIAVGASGNDGSFAFDPPAVRIDPGTTVTWDWTGAGGAHNVVHAGGNFRSGDPQSGDDVTYRRTFEADATVRYFCSPHRDFGMKGALVVGEGGALADGEAAAYGWSAATFDAYWYSLYNMSTNIAMSGNGVTFPATEAQRSTARERLAGIAAAADVDEPPIANPNLNMAPFTTGDPRFTQQPVFENEAGKPDASTLAWDPAASSGVVSPAALAYTHLKGVTWAKNFEQHFGTLPPAIAPKFRAQVLTTLAQLGTKFALVDGRLRQNDENLLLVAGFDPAADDVVAATPRLRDHAAMLWFLSDLVSLAANGWFGYEHPAPLIPATNIQALADGLGKTTMNAFAPGDVAAASTRQAGELLAALGWYGTHAGSAGAAESTAHYATALADAVAERVDGNGRVANGAENQAATQGIVGQGLLWASQVDGVDRAGLADEVLGYLLDTLWDADAGTFASGTDDATYTITARDAGDVTGGLNAAEAVLGRSGVRDRFATFFDETFNRGGLQRAQRPPSVDAGREHQPPLPPKAGGEFGQAAVYNAAVSYDTQRDTWSVVDDTFRTADALYLANQDIWIGQWAGDAFTGRGIPGQTDEPPS